MERPRATERRYSHAAIAYVVAYAFAFD